MAGKQGTVTSGVFNPGGITHSQHRLSIYLVPSPFRSTATFMPGSINMIGVGGRTSEKSFRGAETFFSQ